MSKSNPAKDIFERSGTRYGDYYLDFVRDNQFAHKNKSTVGILEYELPNIIQAVTLAKNARLWPRVKE